MIFELIKNSAKEISFRTEENSTPLYSCLAYRVAQFALRGFHFLFYRIVLPVVFVGRDREFFLCPTGGAVPFLSGPL